MTPTQRPTAPDELARTCDLDGCGADAREWRVPPGSARCAVHAGTVPMPAPDPVAAYLRKRAAIAALWAECDGLWDAMTESQRDHVVSALTTAPRRGSVAG